MARELEELSALLLDSNTAESEFRRRREQEFLAACRGESNAVAAVAGWKEVQGRGPWQLVTVLDADGWAEGSDPIASTLIHRSAALQATIGVDAALFSAGTETHAVVLFKESTGRADHAQVLVHYQLELAKRAGRPVHRIILGTSEGFARPRELADAYRQSRQAAQAAAVDPQLGELVDCRATGIYQLLASAGGGAGAWADAGSVYFRILEDHDRNHELLPVLELFYDNDGSVQERGGQAAPAPEQHLQPAGPDSAAARRRPAQGDGAAGTALRHSRRGAGPAGPGSSRRSPSCRGPRVRAARPQPDAPIRGRDHRRRQQLMPARPCRLRREIRLSIHMATATNATQLAIKAAVLFSPIAFPRMPVSTMAAMPATMCHPLNLATIQA